MSNKAAARGQEYLDNLSQMDSVTEKKQVPTTRQRKDLRSLIGFLVDKYTAIQRELNRIKDIRVSKGKGKGGVKNRFKLTSNWLEGPTRDLTSSYITSLFKNALKIIGGLMIRQKSVTRRRGTFTDKNGNKYNFISESLRSAIQQILESDDFVRSVGQVLWFDGEPRDFAEVVVDENGVFQRMMDGDVYNQVLKDFINLVMRMGTKYNQKLTDPNDYLNDNPFVGLLFDSTGRNIEDFASELRIVLDAEPHKQGTIIQDGNVFRMNVSNIYYKIGEKNGVEDGEDVTFVIYESKSGTYKIALGNDVYKYGEVTAHTYLPSKPDETIDVYRVDDDIDIVSVNGVDYYPGKFVTDNLTRYDSEGGHYYIFYDEDKDVFYSSTNVKKANDLGSFLHNSLATYGDDSRIAKAEDVSGMIQLKNIKGMKYVSEIIRKMKNMKGNFERSKSKIVDLTPEDFIPIRFTSILDDYRGLEDIDPDVLRFFDRYLGGEDEHDLVKKILNWKELQIYNEIVKRSKRRA